MPCLAGVDQHRPHVRVIHCDGCRVEESPRRCGAPEAAHDGHIIGAQRARPDDVHGMQAPGSAAVRYDQHQARWLAVHDPVHVECRHAGGRVWPDGQQRRAETRHRPPDRTRHHMDAAMWLLPPFGPDTAREGTVVDPPLSSLGSRDHAPLARGDIEECGPRVVRHAVTVPTVAASRRAPAAAVCGKPPCRIRARVHDGSDATATAPGCTSGAARGAAVGGRPLCAACLYRPRRGLRMNSPRSMLLTPTIPGWRKYG